VRIAEIFNRRIIEGQQPWSRPLYLKLYAVPCGFNVEKINLVDLIFMDHNGELRRILESHLADPERPQHDLQEILVGNILVPFDPCDS
jgi:hypothetical protein